MRFAAGPLLGVVGMMMIYLRGLGGAQSAAPPYTHHASGLLRHCPYGYVPAKSGAVAGLAALVCGWECCRPATILS